MPKVDPATIKTGDAELDQHLVTWFKLNDEGSEGYEAVAKLLKDKDMDTLKKIMSKRLTFGTAGIRGKMGPGYSQMNDLVINQTTHGLARYLLQFYGNDKEGAKKRGVVLGFDGRYNSKRWAELAGWVFASFGFKVHLYSKMTPTPWVPYAVQNLDASIGVMVTASHNPKNDNGYKVYWRNGAQIIPPHDVGIQKCIVSDTDVPTFSALEKSKEKFSAPVDIYQSMTDKYMKLLSETRTLNKEVNAKSKEKIIYTAMHGVGAPFIDLAMKSAKFKPVIHVAEQKDPDPEFPTVKFPNPEEPNCLDLGKVLGDKEKAIYIVANDPDADRLAVAQKLKDGKWRIFTGNEVGVLLGWFEYYIQMQKNPKSVKKNLYYVVSAVSSKMLRSVAEKEGLTFCETLTGFKWMASMAHEIEQDKAKKVLLAFEEAIGYMCETHVLDKDGIMGGVRICELIAHLEVNESGSTLFDKLDSLYDKYGYHYNENSYLFINEPKNIDTLFARLRNYDGKESYPKSIANGEFKVVGIRDLSTGYDSHQPDNKAILPVSKSAQMLTFTFDNGLSATLRTSGTEPKLKYYTEYIGKPEEKDREKIRTTCKRQVQALINEFIEPEKNNLQSRE